MDLNLRSCCSASARPSVMRCAIFPSSSVAATSNSNAKPVLPDGFCFQIRFFHQGSCNKSGPTNRPKSLKSIGRIMIFIAAQDFFHESDSFFSASRMSLPRFGSHPKVPNSPGDLFRLTSWRSQLITTLFSPHKTR